MRNSGAALIAALASLLLVSPAACGKSTQKSPGKNAILLSNVQALTLRANRMTSSRRVSPIPQLNCIGAANICNLYQIEMMRCTNEGYDYDEEDVQWTCTAPLPPEFKLGSTDVVCEGYRDSDDPWVLKGSCGVEYRMLLTEQGETRFGKKYGGFSWSSGSGKETKMGRAWRKALAVLGNLIFFGFFVAVLVIIFGPLLARLFGWRNPRPRDPRRGWGGFWGGGGGGGGGDDSFYPGPPPPYSRSDCSPGSQRQGWRPGFWSGVLGGAAAGYQMGRNNGHGSTQRNSSSRFNDPGEGSSRRSSPPKFSSTTTSTGFGSTRRR